MKELMDEVRKRFFAALSSHDDTQKTFTKEEIQKIFDQTSGDVYLEKLSQLADRK